MQRKICRLLLALALLAAGAALAEAQLPNPRVVVESAGEIETALGFKVCAPEGVEAVYTVIDGATGEAAFAVGEIECTLRASRTQDDISGLFMEMSEPVEEAYEAGEAAVAVSYRAAQDAGGYGVYTWSVEDVQYCLVLHGGESAAAAGEILGGVLAACIAAQ